MSLHDSSNAKLNCNSQISLKRSTALNYAYAFDRDLVNRSPRDHLLVGFHEFVHHLRTKVIGSAVL